MVLLKLSNLVHLYRVRLRSRWVQELLAVLGIAIGVALLFAASVANTSLIGSVTQLQAGLVGDARLQLVARSPNGFSEQLLREVQDTPGVRAAAPVLETYATVVGPKGERPVVLVGADPRFAHLGGALLRRFTATELARQKALALPASIATQVGAGFGQRVTLDIAGVRHVAPIGAQLSSDDIGSLVNNPIALAPLVYAQQLAGMPGRVTRIFVLSRPGRRRAGRSCVEAPRRWRRRERARRRLRRGAVQASRGADKPVHGVVLGVQRAGGLPVRLQRDAVDRSPASTADR